MEYCCVTELYGVREYLAGASVVGFDFETAPVEQYRGEERAALDAHKAVITGVSFSVAEGSGIYVPLRHRCGRSGHHHGLYLAVECKLHHSQHGGAGVCGHRPGNVPYGSR